MASLLLPIIYLAFISLGLPDALLGAAWPTMYPQLGAQVSWAGGVSMIISACTILSALASDRLNERLGTGRLLVLLASCAIPQTEPFLIDRVLAIAQLQNVPALVVVNKDDLAPAQPLAEIYRRAGVPVLVTSAETGEGIEALREALAGKLSCLTGNSGVGKSSLLNRACPQLQLPVGEVSEKLGRGRHTTRHIELYSLGSNTFVADTPGFSAFDTERMELVHKEQLQYAFPEFAPYLGHCQFPDCAHRKEPGCAVRKALAEGKIGQTRYSSYERLYELASQLKEWELK